MTKKNRHRKRKLRKSGLVSKADAKFIAPLIPY